MAYKFPDTIIVDGIEYPILTSFRAVFLWFKRVSGNKALTPQESAWATVSLFLDDIPEDWQAAYGEICSFILCGKEPEEGEKTFDFEQDYFAIYSAFREKGIDLEREDVHWWAFRALLDDLPEGCLFRRIIEVRTSKIEMPSNPSGADWERYHTMCELKEKYALKEG